MNLLKFALIVRTISAKELIIQLNKFQSKLQELQSSISLALAAQTAERLNAMSKLLMISSEIQLH